MDLHPCYLSEYVDPQLDAGESEVRACVLKQDLDRASLRVKPSVYRDKWFLWTTGRAHSIDRMYTYIYMYTCVYIYIYMYVYICMFIMIVQLPLYQYLACNHMYIEISTVVVLLEHLMGASRGWQASGLFIFVQNALLDASVGNLEAFIFFIS